MKSIIKIFVYYENISFQFLTFSMYNINSRRLLFKYFSVIPVALLKTNLFISIIIYLIYSCLFFPISSLIV